MLHQLPPTVVARLRSQVAVPTLARGVEEAVQNSIDAGATSVDVRVDAATGSFSVVDNGSGIPAASFARLGERYATSKLETLADLAHVQTHGFRGEALASLVETAASVEVVSRCAGAGAAHRKVFRAGGVDECGAAADGAPLLPGGGGTVLRVRDMMRQYPVRKRSLAGDASTRLSSVREVVLRLALVHPAVRFALIDEGRDMVLVQTRRNRTSLLGALRQLYGAALADRFFEAPASADGSLAGAFSSPLQSATAPRGFQLVFINRRLAKNSAIHRAVAAVYAEQAAATGIPQVRPPAFAVMATCAPGEIDVTSVPSKSAIIFADEAAVVARVRDWLRMFFEIQFGVRWQPAADALAAAPAAAPEPSQSPFAFGRSGSGGGDLVSPVGDGDGDDDDDEPLPGTDESPPIEIPYKRPRLAVRGFSRRRLEGTGGAIRMQRAGAAAGGLRPPPLVRQWSDPNSIEAQRFEHIMLAFQQSGRDALAAWTPRSVTREELESMTVIGQLARKFILAQFRQSIYVLDQHAADERIRLEELMAETFDQDADPPCVREAVDLAAPASVAVTAIEEDSVARHAAALERWGFRLSVVQQGGEPMARVTRVPALLRRASPARIGDVLKQHLQMLVETNGATRTIPHELVKILQSKACRSAIMFGDELTHDQCAAIIAGLARCKTPFQCAHGRPSVLPLVELGQFRK